MPVTITSAETDQTTRAFADQLEPYSAAHPASQIDIYRQNEYSVRVRVVDAGFRGKTRSERHKLIWPILYELPEETLSELTMLVLITPEERTSSMASREFDDPIPSRL